jgi:hypothetical protein
LEIDVAIFLALLNKDKQNKQMDLINIKNQLKLAMEFKWVNGQWLHINKVFTQKLLDGQAPVEKPIKQ